MISYFETSIGWISERKKEANVNLMRGSQCWAIVFLLLAFGIICSRYNWVTVFINWLLICNKKLCAFFDWNKH